MVDVPKVEILSKTIGELLLTRGSWELVNEALLNGGRAQGGDLVKDDRRIASHARLVGARQRGSAQWWTCPRWRSCQRRSENCFSREARGSSSTRLCSMVDVPKVEILSKTIGELLLTRGSWELVTLSIVRHICWPQVKGNISKATPMRKL